MTNTNTYNKSVEAGSELTTLFVWILTLVITLFSLGIKGLALTTRFLVKWSARIVFYSILIMFLVSGFLVFCSLYVITFGTLHFP